MSNYYLHIVIICTGIHCVNKILDAHLSFRCLSLTLKTYFIQSMSYLVGFNRL